MMVPAMDLETLAEPASVLLEPPSEYMGLKAMDGWPKIHRAANAAQTEASTHQRPEMQYSTFPNFPWARRVGFAAGWLTTEGAIT